MTNPPHQRPGSEMTWRARAYLIVTALQNIGIGTACLLRSETFNGDAFQKIRDIAPLWAWGIIFLAGGLHLAVAAAKSHEILARVGMPLSALIISLWAAGFVLAYEEGGAVSPVGALIAISLTLKDLIVCAQPMRSPFDPVVKEYANTHREA